MRNNLPVTGMEYQLPIGYSLISRTDLKGKITYVNHAFIEASGFSEEELIGQPHNIVRHPDMPEEAFDDLWRTLKAGNSWTGLVKNRRKNGDHYWVLANATPIHEAGKVIGYTSVRTTPNRQQVQAAEHIYARFKAGTARGLTIKEGKAVRTGMLGKVLALKELHITGKLMTVILLLSLAMCGVGLLGLDGMDRSNMALTSVYEDRAVPLGQLDTIVRLLNVNRLSVTDAILRQDEAASTEAIKEIEHNIQKITATWTEYMAISHSAEEKALAEKFASDRAEFVKHGLLPAVAALKKGDLAEAKRLELEVMPKLFAPVRTGINRLIKLQLDESKKEVENAQAVFKVARLQIVGVSLLGSLVACILAWLVIRAIVRSLKDAVNVAKQIAAGNLTAKIDVKSGDEVGQLMQALSTMKISLGNIITGVRNYSELIQQASNEIATGNMDLSQRTEEQASSLEETASSMEELTSTVRQNAENSNSAKHMVLSARETANLGGQVMDQVVCTMDAIAASSQKITDIISVIDGIAFQTNILALNAAVEAARAGEQGRGFAVVASEVRSLAQRSANAAKEIKALISDSVAKVEGGLSQVTDARKTMDEIVRVVHRATEIMNEISSASAEQSVGIDQVGQAVTQMDQVTQQNAALVEQAAAAADSMRTQCIELIRSVGVFKLEHTMH